MGTRGAKRGALTALNSPCSWPMHCLPTGGWQWRTRGHPRPLECTHTRSIRRTRPGCALCAVPAGCTGGAPVGCTAALQASARLAKGRSHASCNMSWSPQGIRALLLPVTCQQSAVNCSKRPAEGGSRGGLVGGVWGHRGGFVGHGAIPTCHRLLFNVNILYMMKF